MIRAGLADGMKPAGRVTIVVRPEHAELVAAGDDAELRGRLARPASIWVKESWPARKRRTGRMSIQPHTPTPSG